MTESDGVVHRLHPSSLLFSIAGAARSLLIPGIAVLWLARDDERWTVWVMALFVPTTVYHVGRYLTFRYRLDAEELVVRGGVLFRFERHIPFDRIHNIDLVQNPFHRMLGVAVARVQTASGDEPEATLDVVTVDAVERLRGRLGASRREAGIEAPRESVAEEASPLVKLTLGDVLLFGIISNRGMAVVAAAMAIAWELDVPVFDTAWEWGEDRVGDLGAPPVLVAVGVGIVGLLGAFVALRTLSIIWALIKLHRFELHVDGEVLRIRCGLFTRVTATIPKERIQVLGVTESVLHRLFGRVAVRVETAGGGSENQEASREWLVPLLRRERLEPLLDVVQSEARVEGMDWCPAAPRAAWRNMRLAAIFWGGLSALVALVFDPWWLVVGLPVVVFAIIAARLEVRHLFWAVDETILAHRSGWLTRRLTVVRFRKVQSVSLTRSPFDRRWGMARVRVDSAGGEALGGGVDVQFLTQAAAFELRAALVSGAARSSFEW